MAAFNNFAAIAKKLHAASSEQAETSATEVIHIYQITARRDTNAQVDSAYLLTNRKNTFDQAAEAARSDNPKVVMLDTIPAPTDDYTAIAAIGANYAVVNELGGHGRTGDGALANAAADAFAALQRDFAAHLESKLK